jgi:glycosyltransferase involved in cell wall biosynthesis
MADISQYLFVAIRLCQIAEIVEDIVAFAGEKPLVSVIIPSYNERDTLSRALQSAIGQTHDSLEILIVDDGSTDGTEDLVKSFADPRIRYLRRDRKGGPAAARNTGITESKGNYIAFLDSDDEWMKEKIAVQIRALAETGEKVIAGCTGSYLVQGDCIETIRPPKNASWFKLLLMRCGLGAGSTLMASRTAFETVGFFDEELSRLEDWDWLIRYTEGYPFACVSKPLVKIYLGALPKASVVETSTQLFIQKHKKKFYKFGIWYGRKVMSFRFMQLGYYWFRERNFTKGSSYVLKALVLNPLPYNEFRTFVKYISRKSPANTFLKSREI